MYLYSRYYLTGNYIKFISLYSLLSGNFKDLSYILIVSTRRILLNLRSNYLFRIDIIYNSFLPLLHNTKKSILPYTLPTYETIETITIATLNICGFIPFASSERVGVSVSVSGKPFLRSKQQ